MRCTSFVPCAPIISLFSMSAVLEGPVIMLVYVPRACPVPHCAIACETFKASSLCSTIFSTPETTMCFSGSRETSEIFPSFSSRNISPSEVITLAPVRPILADLIRSRKCSLTQLAITFASGCNFTLNLLFSVVAISSHVNDNAGSTGCLSCFASVCARKSPRSVSTT